jgi:hypothetical protein
LSSESVEHGPSAKQRSTREFIGAVVLDIDTFSDCNYCGLVRRQSYFVAASVTATTQTKCRSISRIDLGREISYQSREVKARDDIHRSLQMRRSSSGALGNRQLAQSTLTVEQRETARCLLPI